MIWGIVIIIASLVLLLNTELCRRNRFKCQDGFMTKQGWTRSIFAIQYIGRAKEARTAIVEDSRLRRKYLIESYVIGAVGLLLGVIAIVAQMAS